MIRGPGIGTKRNLWTGIGLSLLLSVQFLALGVAPATGAPKAKAWLFWAANDPAGKARVDHAPWDRFLKKFVMANHPSGINRLRYVAITPEDRKSLDAYVQHLQITPCAWSLRISLQRSGKSLGVEGGTRNGRVAQ